MKHFILLAAAAAILTTACQAADENKGLSTDNTPAAITDVVVKSDVVTLRLNTPVSEPRACIIPISIENGLTTETSVTMIAFDLSGPGEDAKGNMFAPAAAPGEISEARVIVEGQSCEAFDTLSIPEIRCTSGEESCEDKVEFTDGAELRFAQTG